PLKKRDDLGKPSRFADIRKRMVGDIPKSFSPKLCFSLRKPNAALRCEQRLAILERSENAKRCESLLNALLCLY
ncbi:hypothetical protein, partial [Vibrio aestuarianus]|uniref:hypothetical protein n=1 Tax=Vibrio aestuarianus TaxID=28171 RepID=UPI001C3C8C7B